MSVNGVPPTEEQVSDAIAFDFVRVVGTMVQGGQVSAAVAANARLKAFAHAAAIADMKWEDFEPELRARCEREVGHVAAIAKRLKEAPEQVKERSLILMPGGRDD